MALVHIHRKIIVLFFSLVIIFLCGICGFSIIEKWNFLDSLYMTVITLTSIGFGEVHPLSQGGRIFTMILVIFGFGVLLYSVSTLTAFIVEGQLKDILRRRKMEKKIRKLENHYIICGSGETGKVVIGELVKTKRNFVVIEKKPKQIEELKKMEKVFYIEGDASEDEVLVTAGIHKAKGLISTLPADKDNLFIVLTARNLNHKLRIVSRAVEEGSVPKLKKAGADAIVTINAIGGMRLVSEMVRPQVVTFLDQMLADEKISLRIEEASIGKGSSFCGKTLGELKIPQKTELIVVAVKRNEKYVYNPKANTEIKENDTLILLGDSRQLGKLYATMNTKQQGG